MSSEGVSTDSVPLGSQSNALMDLDFMDELLSDGCWLQKADGSQFLPSSPFSPTSLFDPSLDWAILGEPNDGPSMPTEDDNQRALLSENSNSLGANANGVSSSLIRSKDHSAEGFQLDTRWWIGPTASISSMDRLIRALRYIKEWSRDTNILIQVWVPVSNGSRRVLTTSNQPFSLELACSRLASYRDVSVAYEFPVEDSEESGGLPGRVFTGKVPEWTPDVQFFRKDEYPRVCYAQHYDVRGTFGVPVFEQGSQNCLGVIEVVFVTQKIKYLPELENVCKALEAVDLKSSSTSSIQSVKACDYYYQAALPEIRDILRAACETHGFQLAQAWAPCTRQSKEGSRHTDENLIYCVSTVDSACFVGDPSIGGFHEACSEHHLLKGQGIVGRAFMINQPCFSPDITSYTKTEYPLSHHARILGLHAAVAVPMQSTYTGSTDFVVEFFLPVDCKEPEQHQDMITSLYSTIKKISLSLRYVTYGGLQETALPAISKVGKAQEIEQAEDTMAAQERLSPASYEVVKKNVCTSPEEENGKPGNVLEGKFQNSSPYLSKIHVSRHGDLNNSVACSLRSVGKTGEKRRAKAEKTVTLQILQQYFAGSLKDAAMSIGVCPTTLKRICRQHGIKRWPSRKIKKVGHSLQKIQRVIDSVQGASGALPVNSFYSNFPDLAFPNMSRLQQFPTPGSSDAAKALQPGAAVSKSPSSSGSQNSISSPCSSTGKEQHPRNLDNSDQENLLLKDVSVNYLQKGLDSDPGVLLSGEGPKLQPTLPHLFLEQPALDKVPPVPREMHQNIQQASLYKIKVTYGEEKIRFRMQSQWGYGDLMREISKRFGVADTSGFHVKYLDDDCEWVLLTCDEDLEECIDICQSSGRQIIRLSFLPTSQ